MKYFVLIIVVNSLSMNYCSNFSGFNLYRTGHLQNGLYRDCLYYPTPKRGLAHQLIEYCIRSELESYVSDDISKDSAYTFEDLRKQNITSEVLYEWSAPVDLIENYQIYFDNHSTPSTFLFFNCSFPWFGSYCEYSFDEPELSFAQQVVDYFVTDIYILRRRDNLPCYTHLQCDRKGDHGQTPGACLDWREICDGKVDCLDDGADEKQYWQLETNECDAETEFRCRNGQCIPRDFLNDDELNPDCLDRSDEYYSITKVNGPLRNCYKELGFHCEEHMTSQTEYDEQIIECGDGQWTASFSHDCNNGRSIILAYAFMAGVNVSKQCRQAISCIMSRSGFAFFPGVECSVNFLSIYINLTKQHCPLLIELPPLLFGHVRFIYKNDQSHVSTSLINI